MKSTWFTFYELAKSDSRLQFYVSFGIQKPRNDSRLDPKIPHSKLQPFSHDPTFFFFVTIGDCIICKGLNEGLNNSTRPFWAQSGNGSLTIHDFITKKCVCVYVYVSVCVSAFLVNKIPAERMHQFGRDFR